MAILSTQLCRSSLVHCLSVWFGTQSLLEEHDFQKSVLLMIGRLFNNLFLSHFIALKVQTEGMVGTIRTA